MQVTSLSLTTVNAENLAIKQTFRNNQEWNVFSAFNTDNDAILNNSEISAFQKAIAEAAGEDKALNIKEFKSLAKKLNVKLEDLKAAISLVNTEIVAKALSETLGKGKVTKWTPKLLNKINDSNIEQMWYTYQRNIDANNVTMFGRIMRNDNSMASDIMNNFSDFKEAKTYIDKIFNSMVTKAEKEGLDITTIKEKYQNAIDTNNKKEIDASMRELGQRLGYRVRLENLVEEHNSKFFSEIPVSAGKQMILEEFAKKNGLNKDDLLGDGKIGNNPSVPVTEKGKKVLKLLERLMKNDAKFRETVEATYYKSGKSASLYFPTTHQDYTYASSGLVNEDVMSNTTIGDGDMTLVVAAIIESLENYNDFDINKNSEKELERMVRKLFEEELFGKLRHLSSPKIF